MVQFIVQVRHKRKYRTCKNMWNVIRLLCIYLKKYLQYSKMLVLSKENYVNMPFFNNL